MIRHVFPPGEEPQVLTADVCAAVGHPDCPGITEQDGEAVFCVCWCHRKPVTEKPS